MDTKIVKRRANAMVARAVKKGALIRQPCEVCGLSATVAHHDDYSKPLDVRWLCWGHHAEYHKSIGTFVYHPKNPPEFDTPKILDSH